MPATVIDQGAFLPKVGEVSDIPVTSRQELFSSICHLWDGRDSSTAPRETHEIWISSFNDIACDRDATATIANSTGLVGTLVHAHQNDLHLVLRPDDIWLATITQLNYYIRSHLATCRGFVIPDTSVSDYSDNVGWEIQDRTGISGPRMRAITDKLSTQAKMQNMVTKKYAKMMRLDFSTTKDDDNVVSAMTMLGAAQDYLSIEPEKGNYGFPSVTLEGKMTDWRSITKRINDIRKGSFGVTGEEITDWLRIVGKVVEVMTSSFHAGKQQPVGLTEFWNDAVKLVVPSQSELDQGSTSTLGGWVTVFNWWTPSGTKVRQFSAEELDIMTAIDGKQRVQLCVGESTTMPVMPAIPHCSMSALKIAVVDASRGEEVILTCISGFMAATVSRKAKGDGFNVMQPRSGYWLVEDRMGCIQGMA